MTPLNAKSTIPYLCYDELAWEKQSVSPITILQMAQYMSFGYFVCAQTPCLRYKLALRCEQRKLESACASAQLLSAWRIIGTLVTHRTPGEDSDQTRRLIWVFAGHTFHCVSVQTQILTNPTWLEEFYLLIWVIIYIRTLCMRAANALVSRLSLRCSTKRYELKPHMLACMTMLNVIGDTFHPHTTVVRTRGVINLPLNHGGGDMDPTMSLF